MSRDVLAGPRPRGSVPHAATSHTRRHRGSPDTVTPRVVLDRHARGAPASPGAPNYRTLANRMSRERPFPA